MTQDPKKIPLWEDVLSAASRLQEIVPSAVLVGGTAAAFYARHRLSQDADHIVVDLKSKFDTVLADLESVAGWKTARINRPVLILGSLDGIETGIRNLIRNEPLETQEVPLFVSAGHTVTIPTEAEILRIKAALILKRNATRDYVDTVALANHLSHETAAKAFDTFDKLYPQPNAESPTQQLLLQLTSPRPYDLDNTDLEQYKGLDPHWHDWKNVEIAANELATAIMNRQLKLIKKIKNSKKPKGSGYNPW